ncbi:MAG: hypothetical protein WAO91_07190 [Candidatus Nitrosotenuis sp.]
MIHAPSLGIGAGTASAIIFRVFFTMNAMTDTVFRVGDIKPSDAQEQEVTPD